jgi:diguanylate cyclase (GGDEF)-like protein
VDKLKISTWLRRMGFGASSDGNGIRWILAGIVMTVAAVVGREYVPQRSLDLMAPGSHRYFLSSDPTQPWGSRVRWVDERDFHFQCRYAAQDDFGYEPCSLTFLLAPDGDATGGVDLRRYESLHVDLAYQGTSRFVRVAIRTFDRRFSRENDGNSARMQSVNLRARDVAAPLTIGLSEFTVPEWWIAQYNLPREFNIASLDNAGSVTIDLPERIRGAPQDLRVRALSLQGQWIHRETLYFAILCAWVAGALGTMGWRFARLRLRHGQQQLEIEALTVRTARLRAEREGLKRLATIDELTGVLNRRGIEETFAGEESHGRGIALLVLDVDRFKRINDTHGHDTGDLVLQHVAAVIAENIRARDVVGRWGGEEFLVACRDCAPQHAAVVAEKIRQRIEASSFGARHRIAVTASLGVAMMRDGDNLHSAFRRADAALYRAKSMGRNRIVFDDEPEEETACASPE